MRRLVTSVVRPRTNFIVQRIAWAVGRTFISVTVQDVAARQLALQFRLQQFTCTSGVVAERSHKYTVDHTHKS